MYIQSDLVEGYVRISMKTINIFVSYAHEDESLRGELEDHLAFLRAYGHPLWHDRRILAGSNWANEIDQNLNSCDLVLLLISSSFLGSHYCYEVEFKQAMERHRAGETVVIPVIVRDVFWMFGELKELQALPQDGKAVTGCHWQSRDAAFCNVADGIRRIVERSGPTLRVPLAFSHPEPAPVFYENGSFDSLYHELTRLNYRQQRLLFKQFLESGEQVAAFFLSGEPECGQRWLLNRLLRHITGSITGRAPYKFSFERKGGGRGLEDLWSNLGEWCGCTDSCSPAELVEALAGLRKTQTIILILRGLHEIEQLYINAFIDAFWRPLAAKVEQAPSAQMHYCLLFLVDERGIDWMFPCARQIDALWEPRIPLAMEKLTNFSPEELLRWMEASIDVLPSSLALDDLLAGCDGGLPELVFKRICALCGDDWHRREKTWMIY